jgi:hypothetical protein
MGPQQGMCKQRIEMLCFQLPMTGFKAVSVQALVDRNQITEETSR